MSYEFREPDHQLVHMLGYRRPHKSRAERKFIHRFLMPLGVKPDPHGNLITRIGDAPILWSSHTDTVHNEGGKQKIWIDTKDRLFSKFDCLGADDTAGVWLMTEMIKAKIPGLYIFHRGEEKGCVGSKAIADQKEGNPLDGIKAAIAFDRRGKTDIITHQRGRRTASDAFAKVLGDKLSADYKPCPNGVYTDTACYTDLVAECTNISVGYEGAHGCNEDLDVPFISTLLQRLLALKESDLGDLVNAVSRKPGEAEYPSYSGRPYGSSGGYYDEWGGAEGYGFVPYTFREYGKSSNGNLYAAKHDKKTVAVNHYGGQWPKKVVSKVHDYITGKSDISPFTKSQEQLDLEEFQWSNYLGNGRSTELAKLCEDFPDEVADYLEQMGIEVEDVRDHIKHIARMGGK